MDLNSAIAYFITFHTYGTWLHGSEKGSVDRAHNAYGSPLVQKDVVRERTSELRLADRPCVLDDRQRSLVDKAVREVATHRGWRIRALNVRTTHVHVVVSGGAVPERMLGDFKRWATRRLREAGLVDAERQVWSVHGSTRHLFDERAVFDACDYTVNRQ